MSETPLSTVKDNAKLPKEAKKVPRAIAGELSWDERFYE
jgi:hypothetical protein